MKSILIGLALLLSTTLSHAYRLEVIRVIDGDTIQVSTPIVGVPELGKTISIRLIGIDTPESTFRAKCDKERVAGTAAKKFLVELVKPGSIVEVMVIGWDKYGGRILGTASVNGIDISKLMIAKGHARRYSGETKSNWCTE